MNPVVKDIFKEELWKLLTVGFIYSISKSEWVSFTSPQDSYLNFMITHLLRACDTSMVLTWLLGNTKDTSFGLHLFT
jgi:hypothetical protein